MSSEDEEFLEELKQEFYYEAIDTLNDCQDVLQNAQKQDNRELHEQKIQEYKTVLHTLKGSAHAVDYDDVAQFIHFMEDTIKELSGDKRIEINFRLISILVKFIEMAKNGMVAEGNQMLRKIFVSRNKTS